MESQPPSNDGGILDNLKLIKPGIYNNYIKKLL
jgi:hypothetical protein